MYAAPRSARLLSRFSIQVAMILVLGIAAIIISLSFAPALLAETEVDAGQLQSEAEDLSPAAAVVTAGVNPPLGEGLITDPSGLDFDRAPSNPLVVTHFGIVVGPGEGFMSTLEGTAHSSETSDRPARINGPGEGLN